MTQTIVEKNEESILMDDIVQKAKSLVTSDFLNLTTERHYEVEITNIAASIDVGELNERDVYLLINQYLKEDRNVAFNLFFVFYTVYRRAKYGDLLAFCDNFIFNFSDFEITEHIRILTLYATSTNIHTYEGLIKRIDDKLKDKKSKLQKHIGFLNLYAELICAYYEGNLDAIDTIDGVNNLEKALKTIDYLLTQEDYHKYHLNKGRALVLLNRFEEGEKEMLHAINILPPTKDRENRVRHYEQYVTKSSLIKTYCVSNEKFKEQYKELEKIKVNNYKTITLATTIIGYLLSTIQIFSNSITVENVLVLLVAYLSLLLVLAGVLLLGIDFMNNQRNRKVIKFEVGLIALGGFVFLIAILCSILFL